MQGLKLRLRLGSASAVPLIFLMLLSGCSDWTASGSTDNVPRAEMIGDPETGRRLIAEIGCGSCHLIPGIADANGLVGPPLDHIARRKYLAGLLRNTPETMVSWIRNPQTYVPGNAMPDMGLSEEEARQITAYLYTLE